MEVILPFDPQDLNDGLLDEADMEDIRQTIAAVLAEDRFRIRERVSA